MHKSSNKSVAGLEKPPSVNNLFDQSLKSDIMNLYCSLNDREQYARNWSIRVTGLSVPSDELNYYGTDLACMRVVYRQLIVPVLQTTVCPAETDPTSQVGPKRQYLLEEMPKLHEILENGHFLNKGSESKIKKGLFLPPTIIIRFRSRFMRNLFLRLKRYALPAPTEEDKKAGISFYTCSPDLTRNNHSAMTKLRFNKDVDSAWSMDGRIKFRLNGSNHIHTVHNVFLRTEDIVREAKQAEESKEFGGARKKQPSTAQQPRNSRTRRCSSSSTSTSRSPAAERGRSYARHERQPHRERHHSNHRRGVTTRYQAIQAVANDGLLPTEKDIQVNRFLTLNKEMES